MKKYLLIITLVLTAIPAAAFASGFGESEGDITSLMARLVLQLGVIVMIARLIGRFSQAVKLPFPSVLIEVLAGIIIGPYMLGSMPIPGFFPDGIFPLVSTSGIPVSPELYGIATIASIIMLFSAGLETDFTLLLKFSLVGALVGLGGVVLPFTAAAASTSMFFGLHISDPAVLFLGVVCMATSVGVTARIISEQRKMDTPEAVTILAAAVIDDVLSIIALTIVISLIAAETASGVAETPTHAVWVISKAVLVWLGFTVAGILFAGPLSKAIKSFKSVANISIAALGLAFILAGIFQTAGLAMVIGAYVVGLSLSKTDLTDTVRDTLGVLHSFFVPVFFIVMGMLVDPRAFMSKDVLIFGAIYASAALVTNIIGGAIPALFLNFNRLGALRIGVGMIPRGEVALIIAGIGLSSGIIDQKFFGASMVMVLGSIFIAPPLISMLFRSDKKGTKKEFKSRHTVATPINFSSRKLTGILEQQLVQTFRSEGFFVHSILGSRNIYHLRKNDIHITLQAGDSGLVFESDVHDVILIKTVTYEALLHINDLITSVKDLIKPEGILKDLAADSTADIGTKVITAVNVNGETRNSAATNNGNGSAPNGKNGNTTDTTVATKRKMDTGEFKNALTQGSIIPTLTGSTKREIVEKLVSVLHSEGIIKDVEAAVNAVMEREASMSTGMQNGIALPHARTDAVDRITVAVGLSKNGIDYQAFDNKPSKIFVLILSPMTTDSPHIQFLASIATMLNSEEAREKLLGCFTQAQIYEFFRERLKG